VWTRIDCPNSRARNAIRNCNFIGLQVVQELRAAAVAMMNPGSRQGPCNDLFGLSDPNARTESSSSTIAHLRSVLQTYVDHYNRERPTY
jgi:hypothetical protein